MEGEATVSAPEIAAAVLLTDAEPHTPEWHQARAGGIGASEIAAIAGLHTTWDSPTSIYHRKRGELPAKDDEMRLRFGTFAEPFIAGEWARAHPGHEVVSGRGVWVSRERPWQRASPDRFVVLGGEVAGVLELKAGSRHDGWGEDGSDDIPVHYRAQVQWQMDVLGVPLAHVAAYLDGRELRCYTIDYDPADAKLLRDIGWEFWQRVLDGDPPPLDALPATTRALKARWTGAEDAEVQVPATMARQYRAALAAERRAAERKTLAVNRLLERLGDARYAVHDGQRLAVRSVYDRKGYTVRPKTGIVSLRPVEQKETSE